MSSPFVSVIIPVFNDAERLQTCLRALEVQTYAKELYEVIVVDNGSDESVGPIVALFNQARSTYESKPGSYAARNKGVSIAKGEVIAFTDSDCIPAKGWIERGVANLLDNPKCGLVAGKVQLFLKNPARPTAVEIYEGIRAFSQEEYIKERHFGATANIFTFRSVIDDVGPFDERLKSGGDVEWGQRVFSAGYRQIYANDTRVAHPARRSFGQLYRKIARCTLDIRHEGLNKATVTYLRQLFPPMRKILRVWSDKRLTGINKRLKCIFVLLFARYVVVWERTRLLLGGKAKR